MTPIIKSIAFSICLLFAAASFMQSCKKDTVQEPFEPIGYRRGNAYLLHVAILNKPDGKARIYYAITGTDTASAIAKGDGRYSITNNTFKAYGITNNKDTVFLDIPQIDQHRLSGHLYSTFSPNMYECNLLRQ